MDSNTNLKLYIRDYCMYCNRVLRAVEHLGLEIEVRNIWQNPDYDKLLYQATGRRSVPVLEISDENNPSTWVPESGEIVRYLEQTSTNTGA